MGLGPCRRSRSLISMDFCRPSASQVMGMRSRLALPINLAVSDSGERPAVWPHSAQYQCATVGIKSRCSAAHSTFIATVVSALAA